MNRETLELSDELLNYLVDVSIRETDLQKKLRAETAEDPMARMQIAPEQGQFMALLVKLIGAKRCIEVGVFTGYSALAVAQALPDDGLIIGCDVSEEWTQVALRYLKQANLDHKMDLRLAPALETLQSLIDTRQTDSFDFAFIDADKENYSHYYEHCLQLIRPGGLIAVDNVLWGGSVIDSEKQDVDTQAIREFNAQLLDDNRVDISLVPIADGLTLARKR